MGSAGHTLRQPGLFGQMTFDSYTIVLFGFALDSDHYGQACDDLDKACRRLTRAFPFLAGQIICQGRTTTCSGSYSIVPYPPHAETVVRRKDCTALCKSFDEIVLAKAPFSLLDGEMLCPVTGMGKPMPPDEPQPVFIIQANLIHGGLLLTFASQHSSSDMTGQGQIIQYFAQACQGKDQDLTSIEYGNQTPALPILQPDERLGYGFEHLLRPSMLTPPPDAPHDREPAPWQYWRIAAQQVSSLKSHAQAYSANDAIVAFFVQRLLAARVAHGLMDTNQSSCCGRAVNCRAQLGLPPQHLGTAVTHVNTYDIRSGQNLASIAAQLRKALNDVDSLYARSMITLLDRTDDKTTIFYGANTRPGLDVEFSSWAKLPLATLNFGPMLNTPAFVRRPRLTELRDVHFIMPFTKEGDLDLGICLGRADAKALASDRTWTEIAEYLG